MAAGDPGSPARYYSSIAVETALSGSIPAQAQGAANTAFIVASVSGFPSSYPYTLIVDPDTSKEEVVTVTAGAGTTLSVTRGSDNTQGVAHSAGAVVRHGVSGREFREEQTHIAARGYDIDQTILDLANQTHVHGIVTGEGVVVGTLKTQTLTNKTLTSPTITNPSISGAGVDASIVFEGATPDAFETTLTVVDPTQDNTITLPNTTGTVVIANAVQTLTNKTIDMTGRTLTGLSSAGMVSSSATPKDYVDAILGSATAAATSAASAAASATAAATSATSAANSATASASSASASATSATAAATSATSAATSATAAATSATSASNSATAAATSATSAAASATAAATSATSADASATTAAASVATIAGYATASANSASAAATSATSAANSATASANSASAAATSATSAANSATAAATSATSAATSASSALTSQTAAATSATSAATSASSALTSQTAAATSAASAATSANSAGVEALSALTSASSATLSASSAATSASSAATTYDNFDDRYLGSKSTAPTVDNDGNTLLVGAIYWNDVLNNMYVWSGTVWVQIATTSVYAAPTLGSTTIASGTTYSNVTGLTINSTTIPTSKTLVATDSTVYVVPSQSGQSGKYLTTDGTTSSWGTIAAGYSAPTLGSTSIGSGATVSNVNALTINSTTIPTSATLTKTSDNLSVFAATTSAQLAGVISDETGTGSLVFGTSPTITPAEGTTSTAATGAGYMGIPQNATTTGAATIAATDAGKHIYSTATRTLTIPANSSVALPVGTAITFIAGSGATVTIAITTDTMYLAGPGTTGSRTLAAFGMATAVKIASTTWIISGNGLT